MNRIELLTTTSTIQNRDVDKYLDVVTHQIVIGANIFRDVFSSFRDIVGGSARGYQKDLDKWKEIGLNDLKEKAVELGANGILGLRIDFEDVSGGGKSMFMVSLSGTAVIIKNLEEKKVDYGNFQFTFEELDYDVQKKRITNNLENGKLNKFRKKDIQNFITYDIEAGNKVLHYFFEAHHRSSSDLVIEYFKKHSHSAINNFLTSKGLKELKDAFLKRKSTRELDEDKLDLYTLLHDIEWFNPLILAELIETGDAYIMRKALVLSTLKKPFYTKEDIEPLRKLGNSFKKFKEVFPVTKEKNSMFSKDKKVWFCVACDTENSFNYKECVRCSSNIYGLSKKHFDPDELSKYHLDMAEALEEKLNAG